MYGVELVLLGGFGFVLGAIAAFFLASSPRRVVILLIAGIVLAAASFALAWLVAPAHSGDADLCAPTAASGWGAGRRTTSVPLLDVFNVIGWWVGCPRGRGAPAARLPRGRVRA